MGNRSDNAIKWIKELLTTNQEQGGRSLGNKTKGFCCLGLGCHILEINYSPNRGSSEEFQKKVGLLSPYGEFRNVFDVFDDRSLINLNDRKKYTFKQIGEELIKDPENYFERDIAKEITNYFNKKSGVTG